jgi:hypothetical protein
VQVDIQIVILNYNIIRTVITAEHIKVMAAINCDGCNMVQLVDNYIGYNHLGKGSKALVTNIESGHLGRLVNDLEYLFNHRYS